MSDDNTKKTANPFAEGADPFADLGEPPAPRKRVDRDAIAKAGEGLGYAAPPPKKSIDKSEDKPKPRPKPKPKPVKDAPKVNRLRGDKNSVETVQFNQKVAVDVVNGFYDYARSHNMKMGDVLSLAYAALMKETD